jgi:hypothetical protein
MNGFINVSGLANSVIVHKTNHLPDCMSICDMAEDGVNEVIAGIIVELYQTAHL